MLWDEIQEIRWVKDGDFYDLTVPGAEHYSAHGLWHHNSGKSVILCQAAVYLAGRWPGNRIVLGRHDYEDFEKTTLVTFWDCIDPDFVDWKRSAPKDGKVRAVNGSEFIFMHFKDVKGLMSGEFGAILIDEVNDLRTDEIWLAGDGRLRYVLPRCLLHPTNICPPSPNPADRVCPGRRPRYYMLGTGNPDGHNWTWQRAHPKSPTRIKGYAWFSPAPMENADNLPPGYYERLKRNAGNDSDWIRRYVYGDPDVFEAQAIKYWNPQVHVIKPFEIPKHWLRVRALDPAVNGWTCLGGAAVDPQGYIVFTHDYRASNPAIPVHAAAIHRLCEGVTWDESLADTQLWNSVGVRNGIEYSMADDYEENGLEFTRANKDLLAGMARLNGLLMPHPDRPYPAWHPMAGQMNAPGLFVFDTCNEIKTWLPEVRYKQVKDGVSEILSKVGKDVFDCFAPGHEVLTQDGWCNIESVPRGVAVATLSADGRCEFQVPTDYIDEPYSGPMVHIWARGCRLLVTPNHRLLVYPQDPQMIFRRAAELKPQDTIPIGALPEIPDMPYEKIEVAGEVVDAGDWAEFMGWWLSEGFVTGSKGGRVGQQRPGRGFPVGVSQKDGWKADRIASLLARLPWPFRRRGMSFIVSRKALWEHLRPLGNSRQKRIPRDLLQRLSPAAKERMWEALVLGDGWKMECGLKQYATISPGLADDVQELLSRLGKPSSWHCRRNIKDGMIRGRAVVARHEQYYVTSKVGRRASVCRAQRVIQYGTIPYSGRVYCLTVPNRTLLIRREGVVCYTGNCVRYVAMSRFVGNEPAKPRPIINDAYLRAMQVAQQARSGSRFHKHLKEIALDAAQSGGQTDGGYYY